MPKFEAYYAGRECGDQYAKAPKRVTFKHLGKTHLYATHIEADTPDAAYEQLRQDTPTALACLQRFAPQRGMQPGDVLLQADDPSTMLIRTEGGWLERDVTE